MPFILNLFTRDRGLVDISELPSLVIKFDFTLNHHHGQTSPHACSGFVPPHLEPSRQHPPGRPHNILSHSQRTFPSRVLKRDPLTEPSETLRTWQRFFITHFEPQR